MSKESFICGPGNNDWFAFFERQEYFDQPRRRYRRWARVTHSGTWVVRRVLVAKWWQRKEGVDG